MTIHSKVGGLMCVTIQRAAQIPNGINGKTHHNDSNSGKMQIAANLFVLKSRRRHDEHSFQQFILEAVFGQAFKFFQRQVLVGIKLCFRFDHV